MLFISVGVAGTQPLLPHISEWARSLGVWEQFCAAHEANEYLSRHGMV